MCVWGGRGGRGGLVAVLSGSAPPDPPPLRPYRKTGWLMGGRGRGRGRGRRRGKISVWVRVLGGVAYQDTAYDERVHQHSADQQTRDLVHGRFF